MKPTQVKLAVVAGYEPFGDYKGNASARIAKKLDGVQVEGIRVVGAVLRNTYDSHEILMGLVVKKRRELSLSVEEPIVVVAGGLSSSIHKVSLEAVGFNEINAAYANADGVFVQDNRPVVVGAPGAYRTNADLVAVSLDLAGANVPSIMSTDPGRFTCNSLLFGMQHLIASELGARILLIYYHTGVHVGDISGELPPSKIFHDPRWLDDGVPIMVKTLARQAERMGANGDWTYPKPLEVGHVETLYYMK
ncbi:MAG: hypothetical protein ABID61_02315 [Candidatus Micrarchaeota archaeon]